MRRDTNIIPLSRDHHDGLLFCWKIRQGLTKGVSLDRIRRYVGYFWTHHLEEHFRQEENILFSRLSYPLCERAIEEHRQIARLIHLIVDENSNTPEDCRRLAQLVDVHIRFEERQLFPLLEEMLPKERLSAIGAELNRLHDHPAREDYQDPFWT